MGKIYIVGPKAFFVAQGRPYKPGDEIDADLFKKENLAAVIKGGYIIEKGQELAASGETGGGQKSLDDMTLAELKGYAAAKEMPGTGNKAEGLAAINEAEADEGGGETGADAETEITGGGN